VDSATAAIYKLPPDQVTADLNAVAKYAASIPAANGKLAVAGFCWGGAQAFRFPANNQAVKAALVFYGTGPDKEEDLKRINCPVYGFYGGADNRINATIPKSKELMKAAGKTYEPVIYEGAGHGFMRAGEEPDAKPENKKARDEAWTRIKDILKKI
jgi:carboxymethylenebutenolidase